MRTSSRMAGATRPGRPQRRLSRQQNTGFAQGLQQGRAEAEVLRQQLAEREMMWRQSVMAQEQPDQGADSTPTGATGIFSDDPNGLSQAEKLAEVMESLGAAAEGIGKGWGAAKGASDDPSGGTGAILPAIRANMGWLALAGAAVVGIGYWLLKRGGKA